MNECKTSNRIGLFPLVLLLSVLSSSCPPLVRQSGEMTIANLHLEQCTINEDTIQVKFVYFDECGATAFLRLQEHAGSSVEKNFLGIQISSYDQAETKEADDPKRIELPNELIRIALSPNRSCPTLYADLEAEAGWIEFSKFIPGNHGHITASFELYFPLAKLGGEGNATVTGYVDADFSPGQPYSDYPFCP